MLGKKQSSTHEDWVRTMNNIDKIVPLSHIKRLTERTVDDVWQRTRGRKVAFAWSAGKDSIVLEGIMRLAGIEDCLMGMCNLEYPSFLQWVTDHMPDRLEIINSGHDLDWLAKNQDMLFPQDSATAGKWFKMIQHNAQDKYYKKHNLDMIILGRRKADGNYCGKDGIYTNGKGITRYSPLWQWTHEELLAFIRYSGMDLPPIYGWPRGYRVGTHAWAARQWCDGVEHGWSEVYQIDKSIVIGAAEKIDSAKRFLEGVKV